jgi:hypothetical protein
MRRLGSGAKGGTAVARQTKRTGKPADATPDSGVQAAAREAALHSEATGAGYEDGPQVPGRPGEDFWRSWTPAELVAAQGVRPVARFEDLLGRGRDFWTDDEFEEFQKWLLESRRARG